MSGHYVRSCEKFTRQDGVRLVLLLPFIALAIASGRAVAQEDTGLQQLAAQHYAQTHHVDLREALRRLAIQDRAAGIDDELSLLLGDQYAGIWYDADDAGRLKIGIAPGAEVQSEAVRRLVDAYGLGDEADLVAVHYTEAQLQDMQDAVRGKLDDMIRAGHASTSYNTKSNAVIVTVPARLPADEAARLMDLSGSAWIALRRVGVASLLGEYDTCNITYCNPPFRGGREIRSPKLGSCTAAFVAESRLYPYHFWALTAGHCIFLGGPTWNARNEANAWNLLGNAAYFYFAGGPGLGNDAGMVRMSDGGYWMMPTPIPALIVKGSISTVYDPTYAVHQTAFSSVGQMICRTGQTTGTECGEVTDLGADFSAWIEGTLYTTHNLGEVDTCSADGGDSGGPVYKLHRAYGIFTAEISAGPAFCHEFYQGLRGAEKLLNVSVLTSP